MRTRVHRIGFAITTALVVATTTSAFALPAASTTVPLAGTSPQLTTARGNLDQATARALELETEINNIDDDTRALDERIAVTAGRLLDQQAAVDAAEAKLAKAKESYRLRIVATYKRGAFDPLALLLSSQTLSDLMARTTLLGLMAEDSSRVVADLNVAAADARYQQQSMADLQAQDHALRLAQTDRRHALAKLLAEQNAIVAKLTKQAREALMQARRFNAKTRMQWRSSSIPVGSDIPRAGATVSQYPGVAYVISAYMPRAYTCTGQSFSAVSSWYGPGFNGRGAASGQVFNENDLTCASRTLPFGTLLALTHGTRHVIVYVNDRGPYVAGRDLDLSRAAAQALGFSGVARIDAEIVTAVQ